MEANGLDLRIRIGADPLTEIAVDDFLDMPAGGVKVASGAFVSYTNRTLIRAWAEQIGGAHEDWNMDEGLRGLLTLPAFVGSSERQMTAEVLKTAALVILDVARRCLVELKVPEVLSVGRRREVRVGEWPKRPGLFRLLCARLRRRREQP